MIFVMGRIFIGDGFRFETILREIGAKYTRSGRTNDAIPV